MSTTPEVTPGAPGLVAAFARHETFTIRYGWLKNAYDELRRTPVPENATKGEVRLAGYELFIRDDADQLLGVGKNMAKSMRYWLQAARLTVENAAHPERPRASLMNPTVFGHTLLDDETGLDPWLEDIGTWWLLHWQMLAPGSLLPVWWAAFNTFRAGSFSTEQMIEHCFEFASSTTMVESSTRRSAPKRTTIKKDVLAMLRAYAGTSGSRRRDKEDDTIDNPFVDLSLITADDEGKFRFGVGPKPGLPAAITVVACLDYMRVAHPSANTMLVASLAHDPGSPGKVLKLTERDLAALLEQAARLDFVPIEVTTTAGTPSLILDGQFSGAEGYGLAAAQALVGHYRSLRQTDGIGDTEEPLSVQPYQGQQTLETALA